MKFKRLSIKENVFNFWKENKFQSLNNVFHYGYVVTFYDVNIFGIILLPSTLKPFYQSCIEYSYETREIILSKLSS
jgi:hypothetical protein